MYIKIACEFSGITLCWNALQIMGQGVSTRGAPFQDAEKAVKRCCGKHDALM